MKGTEVVGTANKVKVAKNKLAAPFKVGTFEITYGEGISYEASLLNVGVQAGIVNKAGTWFSYGDTRLGQGKENVKHFLKENNEIREDIEKKVRAYLSGKEDSVVEETKEKKSKEKTSGK